MQPMYLYFQKTKVIGLGIFIVSLVSFFSIPFLVSAAINPNYTPLVPLPGITPPLNMSTTGLTDYLKGMLTIGIGICGVLAVVMLVVCGIKMMGTPSASAKSEAKECIWNAIFGLLLAIGSWVFLNTLNPDLVRNSLNMTSSSVSVVTTPPAPVVVGTPSRTVSKAYSIYFFKYRPANTTSTMNKEFTGPNAFRDCADALDKMQKSYSARGTTDRDEPQPPGNAQCAELMSIMSASENTARNMIAAAPYNVYTNNHPCKSLACPLPNGATPEQRCTTLEGLTNGTLQMIQYMSAQVAGNAGCDATKAASKSAACAVVVTGGTECGHAAAGAASHSLGQGGVGTTIDLRLTDQLRAWVQSNAKAEAPSFCNNKNQTAVGCYKRYLIDTVAFGKWWFTLENTGETHFHTCREGIGNWYCSSTDGGPGGLKFNCKTQSVVGLPPMVCSPCKPPGGTGPNACPSVLQP